MLIVQDLAYAYPGRDGLFEHLSFSLAAHQKAALTGNNGTGKSTLLKIIAGTLRASAGSIQASAPPYYIPQLAGNPGALTVAEALRISDQLSALEEILSGNVTDRHLAALNDDWLIAERSQDALAQWGLHAIPLSQPMQTLSGGQQMKVLLAGLSVHRPELVLLDEPANHLDGNGRKLLENFLASSSATVLVVSHDRQLLNLLQPTLELDSRGITVYGGNYDFYAEQKCIERNALKENLRDAEKELRKAKQVSRETAERRQRQDARGKKKQQKEGLPTIAMNTFRNNAEKSTARLKDVHEEKIAGLSGTLQELRQQLPGAEKIRLEFDNAAFHPGKQLFRATGINVDVNHARLWKEDLDLSISSGERIALKGANGAGKTTLLRILLGGQEPSRGSLQRTSLHRVFIDQEYSLLDPQLTVYEQAAAFNATGLQEHELKIRLHRFLFDAESWDKSCSALSGGEKMRLALCCLVIRQQAPDLLVLDEPTNNLDVQNVELLACAIHDYRGTVLVVSHDERFLEELGITRTIVLEGKAD